MKHPSDPCNVDHCARDSKTIACNDGNECKCFCHVPQAYAEARAAYYEWKQSNLKSMLDRAARITFMSNEKIEITDEMVERAYHTYYAHIAKAGFGSRDGIRHALEAALSPPPVICTNCGKPKSAHNWPSSAHDYGPLCPGYLWNPAS